MNTGRFVLSISLASVALTLAVLTLGCLQCGQSRYMKFVALIASRTGFINLVRSKCKVSNLKCKIE